MNSIIIKRIHRVSALVLLTTVLFYLFFQVNKGSPWVGANPFANDPYDAVGSIAIQAALLISILSYARVVRWREDPAQASRVRLILHGNILVLTAIFATLCRPDCRVRTANSRIVLGKHPAHRIGCYVHTNIYLRVGVVGHLQGIANRSATIEPHSRGCDR